MTLQRMAMVLTAVNFALLSITLTRTVWSSSGPTAPVLRGRAIELVDGQGRLRSRLNVEPDGEVVLRLLDQDGTIRVKLGASKNGSGLLLLDEDTEPGVHLVARRAGSRERPVTTSLTLKSRDRARILRP